MNVDKAHAPRGDEKRLKLVVLVVCYNRRESTLRAIGAGNAQSGGFDVLNVLYDDGSTDGTRAAILGTYPDTIVLSGDGTAYWNGGLHRAWTHALELGADAYLWLNDDVLLDGDALEQMHKIYLDLSINDPARRFILVGSTRGEDGQQSYGGHRVKISPFGLHFRLLPPQDALVPIESFNGNVVLIPKQVVDEVGINDPAFHHNMGDHDYGLRATKAGIAIYQVPGTVGMCARNATKVSAGYGSPYLSVSEQWKAVNTHHGLPFRSWWHFTRRHSGIWRIFHFLRPYRNLVGLYRRKRRGSSV